jgi:hypothetical protein
MMRAAGSRLLALLVWLSLACGAAFLPAGAMAADGVSPPAHVEAELPKARLAGAGNFRYFGLNIYRPAAPKAEKFALDLRYARSLDGKKIAASSADEMKKLGLGSAQQRVDWQAKMEKIFPDVQEGTRITGVYLPNQGARFYRDGKPLGEILDPEFGYAFFAIWLDPKTTGGKLRDALLADAAPH